MNKPKLNNINILFFICNIFSLAYLLILAYYNRPTIDDFDYISTTSKSFLGSIDFFYNKINGRFLPNTITGLIFIVYPHVHTLFFVTVIFIFLFWWIINKIISNRLMHFISPPLAGIQKLNFILFFITIFIIYNFEINTFTWTIACIIYYGSIFFALVLLYCITDKTASFKNTITLVISALFIGCSNESFSVIIDFLLILFLAVQFVNNRKILRYTNLQTKKIIYSIIIISLSFIIMYVAPASKIRLQGLQAAGTQNLPLHISELPFASIRSYFLLWKYILFKIPWLILAAFPFSYFTRFIPRIKFRFSVPNLFSIALLLWLFILPTTYAINYTPFRVLTPVWFFLLLLCIAIATKLKYNKGITIVCIIIFLLSNIYKIYSEIPAVKKYTAAYDERIEFLTANNKKESIVTVDSLPDITFLRYSGILLKIANQYLPIYKADYYLTEGPFDNPFRYSPYRDAEITKNADGWQNIQLKNAVNLKSKVAVK